MKKIGIVFTCLLSFILVFYLKKNQNRIDRNNEIVNTVILSSERTVQVLEVAGDTTYESILGDFKSTIVQVRLNSKCGLFDTLTNELLTAIRYDNIGYFANENHIQFCTNDKYGFLNESGNEIIGAKYDLATDFTEGLACVKLDELWGMVNTLGEIIVPIEYEMAWPFHMKNRAAVKKDGKWGFINEKGKCVIDLNYDNVTRSFETETKAANVSIKGHNFFIDEYGTFIKDSSPHEKYVK